MSEKNSYIRVRINEIPLEFKTTERLFSPNSPDKGTLAMIKQVDFKSQSKILDLGCGWGLVGIYAAKLIGGEKVLMSDISDEAVSISMNNALINGVDNVKIIKSDGFSEINEKDFSLILNNPPYHTDFSTAKLFIEKGFNRLALNGRLMMVTKRRDWYKNKIISVFGGVEIFETDGYFVFSAEKRSLNYASKNK